MNRVLVACVALFALAGGSATAAELSPYYQPGPAYNPIYTWTGIYVGIHSGGPAGYSRRAAKAVIGAEGDIDWSGIKGTSTVLCLGGCETRNKWLATARRRGGFALHRFLPSFTRA